MPWKHRSITSLNDIGDVGKHKSILVKPFVRQIRKGSPDYGKLCFSFLGRGNKGLSFEMLIT